MPSLRPLPMKILIVLTLNSIVCVLSVKKEIKVYFINDQLMLVTFGFTITECMKNFHSQPSHH